MPKDNKRLTVKQLLEWLEDFPDDTPLYYDMDCIYGRVDLRVEIPAPSAHELPLVSTISL